MNAIELLKYGRGSKGTNYFIRGLLVLQFSLSIIVFIAGIACSRNISYQNELGFGYDKERILTVSIDGDPYFQRFKNAIVGNSKIEGIAGTANHIGPYTGSRGIIKLDTTLLNVSIYNVGVEYLDVMGLKMSSGRGFLQGSRADYESAVIIDRNFVINHGLANPIDALVVFNDRPYRVIGVAENHLSGLKEDSNSEHLFMLTEPSKYRWMVVRTRHDDILTVRSDLENRWKAVFPGIPFECKLQAEMIHEESKGYNNNLRQILFFITLLGCLLSTSGIYASASLNVQKRTKEIGVRKVLGASVVSIIRLLNREFVVILALAVLLGSVGGRILTNILLDQYTQHIKPDAITILFCSLAVFLIGIFATSSTIFRTASANPTTTLRNE
jgi:ABC-type antimicrobial peptide transport system permease subunit